MIVKISAIDITYNRPDIHIVFDINCKDLECQKNFM